jgi:hypothetical protein
MKAHQVNVPASTVVSDPEEIDNPKETRLSRQLGSNVRKTDRLDGVHFDLAFLHPIAPAYLHMRMCPDADTASDFSTTNAISQTLGERHCQPLRAIFATLLRARRPSGNGSTAAGSRFQVADDPGIDNEWFRDSCRRSSPER